LAGDYKALKAFIEADSALAPLVGQPLLDALAVRETVPAPILESEMMACLSVASLTTILNWANLRSFKDDVAHQNLEGVGFWVGGMAQAGRIQPAEYTAIQSLLGRTEATGKTLAERITGGEIPATIDDLKAIGKAG